MSKILNEKLGDRLKRMREQRGLGLRETANLVGISATYLSRIENNKEPSPPSEEKIRRLADELGEDFDELMRLADRLPSDVTEIIKMDDDMPAFLRRARENNVSAKDLLSLLEDKKRDKK